MRFLRWFCRNDFLEEIEGDLVELFERQYADHPGKARRAFSWGVLRHFRPAFIRAFSANPYHLAMLRHNLLISYRGFLRNKTFFLVNLIGLATGLASVWLISLWVHDEWKVDQFHTQGSRIHQILNNYEGSDGIQTWELTPFPLADALMNEFPEVEVATFANRGFFAQGQLGHTDAEMQATRLYTDPGFFSVFSFDLLRGDPATALDATDKIVITEAAALRLFGAVEDAMGQSLSWTNPYFEAINGTYTVSGVCMTPPPHSSEKFDALLHRDLMIALDPPSERWESLSGNTYAVLKKGTDLDQFNAKIAKLRERKDPSTHANTLFAQQFSKRYLYGKYENGQIAGGRIEYVRIFTLFSLLILLIACINFINLSTAQATKKMKEIGVKKSIGATKSTLIQQFLTESVLMVFLASCVAGGLVYALLPHFNSLSGKLLSMEMGPGEWGILAGIILLIGLLAGSYPAFFLSKFEPIITLKGNRSSYKGEKRIRQGLVVCQFALAILFLLGLQTIDNQLQFIQNKPLGYSQQNVISFIRPPGMPDAEPMLAEIRKLPGVEHTASMARNIFYGEDAQLGYSWRGKETDKNWVFQSPQIGFDAIETLDMEVVAGRSFSRAHQDDTSSIILNEAAVKHMQLEDPIGTRIAKNGSHRVVVGVVADFNYGSLYQSVKPLIFRLREYGFTIMVKMKPGTEQATLAQVETLFTRFSPETDFNFSFLDAQNQQIYEAEQRVGELSRYASVLSVIIVCLGLFGLATFNAETRKKEIGIRKILGASASQILALLSKDYLRLVMLGFLVAAPIAWYLMDEWLHRFAYHVDIHLWMFVGTGVLAFLVAFLTVGGLSLKVAVSNPVDALRDE